MRGEGRHILPRFLQEHGGRIAHTSLDECLVSCGCDLDSSRRDLCADELGPGGPRRPESHASVCIQAKPQPEPVRYLVNDAREVDSTISLPHAPACLHDVSQDFFVWADGPENPLAIIGIPIRKLSTLPRIKMTHTIASTAGHDELEFVPAIPSALHMHNI